MNMINVLSLFDGYAGARAALDRLGIECNYYASEIDKWAIKIAQKNYPDVVQLGPVQQVNPFLLPKIDLLIGGSPCQDLSFAGKGKGLSGERSSLFFDYIRLLNYLKPKYFVLENVRMSKLNRYIFSLFIGVQPIEIDSALVSAQMRKRLYWTNISEVQQPEDKGILLKDIIDSGIVDRDKSYCIDANYYKGTTAIHYAKHHRRQVVFENQEALNNFYAFVDTYKGQHITRQKRKDIEVLQLGYINKNQQGRRVYVTSGKALSLKSGGGGWGTKTGLYFDNNTIKKLTPIECERLQTLDDNYTEGVSNTQRYRMLGNGFTVDVIAHILSFAEF